MNKYKKRYRTVQTPLERLQVRICFKVCDINRLLTSILFSYMMLSQFFKYMIEEMKILLKTAFKSLFSLFIEKPVPYDMEGFIKSADENLNKKGTVDFSKEIERFRKIINKSNL